LLFGPCGQDIIAFFSEVREDFNYLFGSFAGAVNDFREATANLAVMVYAGKAQILKRQMAKFGDSFVDGDLAILYL
jgi:spermidine/putrescine-binding protein